MDKQSPSYIEQGKKCEFILTTFDNSSGLLESPLHSLPPNTTCHYHFRGQPKEVVWISFIKYHVTNDRITEFDSAECDVQLQVWDGNIKAKSGALLMGQFCKDDKPKLCDHTLLSNSSRRTRPCGIAESYVSSGPDLTITHSIRYGNVLYPVNFVLRYEFVDLSQEGLPFSLNPCDRIFKDNSGKFYSPRITFLYGRGGQRSLKCAYNFESASHQRMEIAIHKAAFGAGKCRNYYHPETDRWRCESANANTGNSAFLKISEYPWPGVELERDCFCENVTESVTITTKTAKRVVVSFVVNDMKINEDYNDYYFEATYEFLAQSENQCTNPWKNRRLKGSSGEITVRNNNQTPRQTDQNYNQSLTYCTNQPWLIEPEDAFNNYLYLKIKGFELKIKNKTDYCETKNRIVVYAAGKTTEPHIICPSININPDELVELFSEGWSLFSYRHMQLKNARSFIIEFLQHEPGNFVVTWMEVSKNPALTLPTSLLMISPPDCPHR